MIVISRRLCRDIIFAALTVLLTGTTPTYAGCTVFEHRDWGGARFRLNDNNWLMMGACSEDTGSTSGGHGYCRRNWNDRISSYRVTDNCKLTLWADANDYTPAGPIFSRDYGVGVLYVGDSWNDKASYASCSCR
jgi:hypothetical protein